MTEPLLETEGLTKTFGELTAVDNVNLSIPAEEFRSVIGPNGAGKTTLFELLSGSLKPTNGTVRFQGEDVTHLPPHQRVRRGIGRSFQITNIFGGLSVAENIRLAAQSVDEGAYSMFDRFFRPTTELDEVNALADEIMKEIGLTDAADTIANNLDYGSRRRLEIGLVLATDPDIVLLDEPTAGISASESWELLDIINEVLSEQTLVLIEHDIDLVMQISDRITVLNRGAILAEGTPAEIQANEAVQKAYLGGA